MQLSIALTTIFTAIVTTVPNLCDDVYLDPAGLPYTDWIGQTLSRYCQWAGPDVPVWDKNVCCTIDDDGAHCSRTDPRDRCRTGLKMYCEYGAAVPGGGVICYQPFPSMCDAGFCVAPPEVPPPPQPIHVGCCSTGGVCQLIEAEQIFDCQGYLLACYFGELHDDGTVQCYD